MASALSKLLRVNLRHFRRTRAERTDAFRDSDERIEIIAVAHTKRTSGDINSESLPPRTAPVLSSYFLVEVR